MFCILADRSGIFELDVINRGRFPLSLRNVTEYRGDRRDLDAFGSRIRSLGDHDCIIDFCAYEPGDSALVVDATRGCTAQYILISSCSVFEPSGETKDESSPKRSVAGEGPAANYAYAKMLLEREAVERCIPADMACTIIRPAMIYGPFNYAPREGWYFDRIIKGRPVPVPTDADSKFSFVYVKDVADALMRCIGSADAINDDFIIASPEEMDYRRWIDLLNGIVGCADVEEITVTQAVADNAPLPWPLCGNDVYDGSKAAGALGLRYTDIASGMRETFDVYVKVHG